MGLMAKLSKDLRGEVRCNEPMERHTSLKVGGLADYLVIPADREELQRLLLVLIAENVPWIILGGGYNLLVRDGGYRGVVIHLARLNSIRSLPDNRLEAEAGVLNRDLVRFCREHGVTGLEFLIGIPGTIGGALAVNAGAHGKAVMEMVDNLTILDHGKVDDLPVTDLNYGYRYLELAPRQVIVSARFQLDQGVTEMIDRKLNEYLAHRREKQQVNYPSAGSFFKNPPGGQAWRLIEAAGLRGYQIGGAQVAEAHCNFLVNRGTATATDFLALARLIKDKVFAESGIMLEEEVRIVGEELQQQ